MTQPPRPTTSHAHRNRAAWNADADDELVFQLPYGQWIRLFRANGLEILHLIEPRPAPESIWRLRRS